MITNRISILIILCWQLLIISSAQCHTHNVNTKCTLQDSDCLIKKSNAGLKGFTSGIPELGIKKLDKMFIDLYELNTDGIIHELKNIEVEGLNNATINDLRFNEALKIIRLSFDTTLKVTCEYNLEGFLFMQPITGEGTATYTMKNVRSDMIFMYNIKKKGNGKHMLDIKDYRFGLDFKGGIQYKYQNLFGGDKAKNDAVNAFLDENWTVYTNIFGKDFYDKIYRKIFKAIKKYTHHHNLEDIISF